MVWKRQLRTTLLLLVLIGIGLWVLTSLLQQKQEVVSTVNESDLIQQEVTDATVRYQARTETDKAALRQTAGDSTPQKAELVIEGLTDKQTMQSLLDILSHSGLSATFFITGQDATLYADSLSLLANRNNAVGIAYADNGSTSDLQFSQQLLSGFVRTGSAVQTAAGIWPSQLLAVNGADSQLLAVAYACSIDTVLVPTSMVTLSDVASDSRAQALVEGLDRGSILCLRLNSGDGNATTALASLCTALSATDLQAEATNLLATGSANAQPLTRVYTTEPAAAFTFCGLGNEEELQGVLSALRDAKATATFFVTRDELTRYASEVQQILDQGHSLGIAVQSGRFPSVEALLQELLLTRETLRNDFKYTAVLPVRSSFGNPSEELQQACGAAGFTLVSSLLNAVRTDDIRATDAAAVLESLLPASQGDLQRGEIVHFQMNQYQKSNSLLGELVKQIATNRNIYAIKPILEIANNHQYVYQYPLAESSILPEVYNKIYPGQLTGNVMAAISSRYIGVSWVASAAFLPGFTYAETRKLDKSGFVANNSNMVFLSFDDWGTDKSITSLLTVLKAHNAKATFFIRTQYVPNNPNLLRAIAMDGHTIGCHTNTHYPLAEDAGGGRKFAELTQEEASVLQQDLVTSYNVLQSIVGDLKLGDRPALSLLFRPPTLAVSKLGLATVLDCGFSYSVSGSFSSQDYKATSAENLAANLEKNTKSGAVLVMHMSDTGVYTAEALDIYLTDMETKYADKPYQFASLSEVLK